MRNLRYLLIALLLLMLTLPAVAQDTTTISIGETVEGQLSAGNTEAAYTFSGELGQVVIITLTSTDFDSYLRLRDADGRDIATDDDGAGSLNAQIGPFALPDNGEYTIIATSFGGNSTGSYSLSLAQGRLIPLAYGETAEGELTGDNVSDLYTFDGQAGDFVVISMQSTAFDSYLELRRAGDSYSLITDEDGGGNRNAEIAAYELPETAQYQIIARGFGSTSTGSYTIALSLATLTPISYGDSVEVEIEAGGGAYFTFEGQAGEEINIRVNSDDAIDTGLVLRGPYGYVIAEDSSSGGVFDPAIERYLLVDAGTYTFVVRPSTRQDTGLVTVSLTQSELASLDDGPQTLRFSDSQQREVLTFAGVAGEKVRLTLVVTRGDSFSPSISMIQAGVSLGYNSMASIEELSFVRSIPEDGPVTITIEDYSYHSVVATLTLERLGGEADK